VAGGDLGQALDGRPGPLPWPEVWPILQPIVQAVTYAHDRGVVHRDLKPENVLLEPNGSWPGTPLVADFGIAKVLGSDSATRTQARMGTACYGAPEQFRNAKDVGEEADVWALGMLAWRLVMGELPIDPEDNRALFMLYEGTAPVPRLQQVPDTVADAVGAALQVDPRQRPRNAGVLGKLLAVEPPVPVALPPLPVEPSVVAPSGGGNKLVILTLVCLGGLVVFGPSRLRQVPDVPPVPVVAETPVAPSRLLPEVCDGQDNDGNGATDDPVCGSGACTCGADGVATCPADCKVCPDEGDLAIPIDDGGTQKVVCAHDYPAWGIVAEAPSTFTDRGDGTVGDSKTGLMWQLIVSDSKYSWASARQYCDDLTLASNKDWRLPTTVELESLLDFAATSEPAIATPFVAAKPADWFWSATSFQGGSSDAWAVSFFEGSLWNPSVAIDARVRCVRASGLGIVVASDSRYEVNAGAETVFDTTTGLTWQVDPPVTGGSNGMTDGQFNQADAKQYCADLVLGGQNNWRLPGVVELRSLLKRNVMASPAIDAVAFPNTPLGDSSLYWSATSFRRASSFAWTVDFRNGQSYQSNGSVTDYGRVRCVR
jgi:hypothetical protein